jgi:hypothetical protein
MRTLVKGKPELIADFKMRADRYYGMDGDGIQAPGMIVIAYLRSNKQHPFVVWFANTQAGGTSAGDYCTSAQEATEAFYAKCKRYDPTGELNKGFNEGP